MEKVVITPIDAANLSASYLRTSIEGEEQIRVNKEERDSLIQQIAEDMHAEREGGYDPAYTIELLDTATALDLENIQLEYRVKNMDAKARTLYEHREGNSALREAALADAALAGVHINV